MDDSTKNIMKTKIVPSNELNPTKSLRAEDYVDGPTAEQKLLLKVAAILVSKCRTIAAALNIPAQDVRISMMDDGMWTVQVYYRSPRAHKTTPPQSCKRWNDDLDVAAREVINDFEHVIRR